METLIKQCSALHTLPSSATTSLASAKKSILSNSSSEMSSIGKYVRVIQFSDNGVSVPQQNALFWKLGNRFYHSHTKQNWVNNDKKN